MNLYTTQAEEFSKTRTAPWSGWQHLVDQGFIDSTISYNILDLGCGNGRLLKFVQTVAKIESYLGVDNSNLLLSQAKKLGGEYLKIDLDNTTWQINSSKKFNLITAFGIVHHLSTFENRKYFLQNIANHLEEDGIAIVTYWQFLDYERYHKKIKPTTGDNNYLMSFGKQENARFCHFTNQQEIEKLEKESGLKLIDNFRSDGRDNTENIYRVYRL